MKSYLIVGGTGSIGQATVNRLVSEGFNVLVSSRTPSENRNHVALDLADRNSFTAFSKLDIKLDGVVFAAGYEPKCNLDEMSPEHQQTMIAVHVTGPLNLLQSIRHMLNPGAAITFISSIAAYKGSYDPMYSTVKGAVLSMTRTLAVELGKNKIRVNCIAPGLVEDTPVFNRMTTDFREKHLGNTLNNQLATPLDCAEAIYFLLTQKHITGQVVHINGGQYFGN